MILGDATAIAINTIRIGLQTFLKIPGVPVLNPLTLRPDSMAPHDILYVDCADIVHDPFSKRLS